ncbi:LuxR C-terminal-related transcriptional regulator [Nucisporomicrobium flavum]|uniref:LuxR C-terminal-related transcriptional regulator n=1 Tax=Nucisporomicrobium flavum TaxID=2785915 RepID=UPI003C2BDDFB
MTWHNGDATRVRAEPMAAGPKFARPHVGRSRLFRPRLIGKLDAGTRGLLTLVSAGPGWGKTTLVAAWAATQRVPMAWLTLDRYDNDPQIFAADVVAALRAGTPAPAGEQPGDADAALDDDVRTIRGLGRVLGRLRTPMVLILDDFDMIEDHGLLAELDGLLRAQRSPVRMVLISRSEPALQLHRLRAAGELTEIRAHDLAFTAEEAAELLAGQGLNLTPDEVTTLVERTEGWAVGLQLAAAFVSGPHGRSVAEFAGDFQPVEDYLSEELLARQTPQFRTFLLYTSICEHLCADLADAITLGNTGQRTLERLEQVNQFVVRLNSRPSWFRYHHLIRDMLRHRLAVERPGLLSTLHRRAAGWYAEQGSVLDAFGHAVSAQDWEYVGRLVVDAAPMVLSRDRRRLVKVIEQIPPGELASTAELAVCGAILLFNAGDYPGIREQLGEAQKLLAGRPETDRRTVEIAIRALRGAVNRVQGDMPAMLADTTSQLTELAQVPLAQLPSTLQYRAIALNNSGVALLWTGRPAAAERYLSVGAAAAHAAGLDLVEINAIGHLALLEVMFGSVREAENLVRDAHDRARRGGWMDSLQVVAAHLAAALVELERVRPAAAERALQQAVRAHRSDPEAVQRKLSLGVSARLAMAQNRLPSARVFLDEAKKQRYPIGWMPTIDRWLLTTESEMDVLSDRADRVHQRYAAQAGHGTLTRPERNLLIRAALATRDLAAAEAVPPEPGSLMSETVANVEAHILDALVSEADGRGLEAAEMLGRAIALAAPEGIRRPFLSLAGGRLGPLLTRQSLTAADHAPFITDLLHLIGTGGPTGTPRVIAGTLSDREAEVLRYLPTMLTAAEIGEELGVSVNTIKAHMRAIYRKLGTPRRRQAVVRARELGLI